MNIRNGEMGRATTDRVTAGIAEQTEEIAKVFQQSGKLDKAAENSAGALGLRTEIVNRRTPTRPPTDRACRSLAGAT